MHCLGQHPMLLKELSVQLWKQSPSVILVDRKVDKKGYTEMSSTKIVLDCWIVLLKPKSKEDDLEKWKCHAFRSETI